VAEDGLDRRGGAEAVSFHAPVGAHAHGGALAPSTGNAAAVCRRHANADGQAVGLSVEHAVSGGGTC
ncbi:hypothetical protein ABTE21_19915, partial [Acinetobacter baumannii]